MSRHLPRQLSWAIGLFMTGVASVVTMASPQAPADAPVAGPVFRSGAELFIMQVQLVSSHGEVLTALKSDQFSVMIDNIPRRIRFAEAVGLDDGSGEPVRALPGAALQWNLDSFFTPVPNKASVQYVLGVEGRPPTRTPLVRVVVDKRGVGIPRWMWRTQPPEAEAAPPVSRTPPAETR